MVDNPKVMIGIPTAPNARYPEFYDRISLIDKPNNYTVIEAKVHGQSPARNRNLIIAQAIKHECTHILFIDDDVLVPSDVLTKLMSHDKDIVSGLYLMRAYPHQPIIFSEQNDEGLVKWSELSPGKTGLIEIVSAGLGCVLIKIRVFKTMQANDPLPWVRLGEIEPDHWCDDTGFFKRVKKYGFRLFCDLDVQCGHIAKMTVRPVYKDGRWYTEYDTEGMGCALVPGYYQETVNA